MDPVTPINQEQPTIPPPVNRSSGLISPSSMGRPQASGNLMNPISIKNIDGPRNQWKFYLLDAWVLVGAGLFGYTFSRYLTGGFSFWLVLATLFLWGAGSVLEGFLQIKISRRFVVIFLETIALLPFFITYDVTSLLIIGLIVIVCLLWGYLSVRREIRNTIEIRFFTASGKVMGKLITAAVIFMIVIYGALMNNNGRVFVSEKTFDAFFYWSASFVNNFYPNLPLNGSLGDFAEAIARMQLQNNPQFQNLTSLQQQQALAESSNQIAANLSGAATAVITSSSTQPVVVASSTLSQPASNAFYAYLSALTDKAQNKFGNAFVGVWGLAIFLLLRSIGIVVVWAAQIVALIFYELLLALGFMKITEHPATQEMVEC